MIRFDIIRSFDRPLISADMVTKVDIALVTELDLQLFQLQRKYLDYQVNVGKPHHRDFAEGRSRRSRTGTEIVCQEETVPRYD